MSLHNIPRDVLFEQKNLIEESYKEAIKAVHANPYVYLFHGTLNDKLANIKQQGLRRDKQWSAVDSQVKAATGKSDQVIFLTSSYSYAFNTYTKPGFGLKFWAKRGQVLLCKVSTKLIKHHAGVQLTRKRYSDEFWYYGDIPPSNIMFETNPKYMEIVQQTPYLYHPNA